MTDPQAMTDKGPRTAEVVRDPYGYRVRIAVPEDHAPDDTVARWTADASAPVGYPYTYSTIGVSVYVDFAGDDEDTPEKRGISAGHRGGTSGGGGAGPQDVRRLPSQRPPHHPSVRPGDPARPRQH